MALLCALNYTAWGQSLSLDKAVQLGLERNFDVQIEAVNKTIAANNNNVGEAGLLPKVDLSVAQNNNLQKNIKTAFPTSTQGETGTRSIQPGINVNWTLYNGQRARITKTKLEQLQNESAGNADIVMANTIQAIVLGYYRAVLEKGRLQEFERQIRLSRDKFKYTLIKSEIGSAVSSDLLLEEGNYLNDSTNYFNQELIYRNAIRDLNVLLAEPDINKEYEFSDQLEVSMDNFDYGHLAQKLHEENVDLRKLYLTQKVLQSDVAIQRAGRMPTLSLDAGYNDNRQSLDLSNATFFTGDGFQQGPDSRLSSITDTYFANFTLSFNLFNGRKTNTAIRNSMLQEDIGNIRIERLKQSLAKDLADAYDRYEIRKRLYDINVRKHEVASANLNLSEEKYRNGTINSFDYRIVQNNNLSAAIEKLQSLYNLIDSQVTLLRLTGGILSSYGG